MIWPLAIFLTPDLLPFAQLTCSGHTGLLAIPQTFQAQAHLCLRTFTYLLPLPGMLSPHNDMVYSSKSFRSLLNCPLLFVFLISPIFKNPLDPIFICLVMLYFIIHITTRITYLCAYLFVLYSPLPSRTFSNFSLLFSQIVPGP